jgi:hypothetical protein
MTNLKELWWFIRSLFLVWLVGKVGTRKIRTNGLHGSIIRHAYVQRLDEAKKMKNSVKIFF